MSTPSLFISYSHDDLGHKRWVLDLSTRLRKSGVDVILDQWDLGVGDDLGTFMTNSLDRADRVLMVCTQNYVEKANAGKGGVGVERMILTAEYMDNIDSNKVIPLIKHHGVKSVPTFFQTKLYIDFSIPSDYEASFDNLLRAILEKPLFEKPEIGTNPYDVNITDAPKPTHNPLKDFMQVIVDKYERTGIKWVDFKYLHDSKIASSRTMTDIIMNQAAERGYITLDIGNACVWLADEGQHFSVENELV